MQLSARAFRRCPSSCPPPDASVFSAPLPSLPPLVHGAQGPRVLRPRGAIGVPGERARGAVCGATAEHACIGAPGGGERGAVDVLVGGRRAAIAFAATAAAVGPSSLALAVYSPPTQPERRELTDYGEGVKGFDVIVGAREGGREARAGDSVRVLLKGRLAAKQGWIFLDDETESAGEPRRYTIGSGEWIQGLDVAMRGMREGGVRRVIIPPPVSYQAPGEGPRPGSGMFRRRLESTIFNPTRIANGEGDTLATVIFDVELVRIASE